MGEYVDFSQPGGKALVGLHMDTLVALLIEDDGTASIPDLAEAIQLKVRRVKAEAYTRGYVDGRAFVRFRDMEVSDE